MKLPRTMRILPILLLLAGCAVERPAGQAAMPAPRVATSAPAATFVNARAIIILRHADIDPAQKISMGNAAPLTKRGEERAREILTALKDAGITRIVTSAALRTQETAQPLADLLKIKEEEPFIHGPEGPTANVRGMPGASEATSVVQFLAQTAKPDQTILLVHHHSVIPSIMKEFGFPNEPAYDDATEFDRVYVLLPDAEHKTYQLLRLRFGGKWD